jgi:hypothetical protein
LFAEPPIGRCFVLYCRILDGKPEGKTQHRRPRHRLEDNTEMALRERNLGGVVWIHVAEDRDLWWHLVNIVMKFEVPYKAGNFLID